MQSAANQKQFELKQPTLSLSKTVPVIVSNFNYFYNRETTTDDLDNINLDHVRACPYWPDTSNRFEVRRLSIEATKEESAKYPLSRRESDLSTWTFRALDFLAANRESSKTGGKLETASSPVADFLGEPAESPDVRRIEHVNNQAGLIVNSIARQPIVTTRSLLTTSNPPVDSLAILRAHNLPESLICSNESTAASSIRPLDACPTFDYRKHFDEFEAFDQSNGFKSSQSFKRPGSFKQSNAFGDRPEHRYAFARPDYSRPIVCRQFSKEFSTDSAKLTTDSSQTTTANSLINLNDAADPKDNHLLPVKSNEESGRSEQSDSKCEKLEKAKLDKARPDKTRPADALLSPQRAQQRTMTAFDDKRNSRSTQDLNPIIDSTSNCLVASSSCNSLHGTTESQYRR